MKRFNKLLSEDVIGYCFALPALLFMLFFVGYPILSNLALSFMDVNVMTFSNKVREFVGLVNYIELLKEPILSISFFNTLLFAAACIVFQFILGFALALLFNQKFPLAKPMRGFLIISWMIPITITALIFKFMFSLDGIINEALKFLHIISVPIEWLIHPVTAMLSIMIANIWIGIPFNMILLSTGLSTIPNDIYESANIDGAGSVQKFLFITLPMLKPAINSVLVLGFIYTCKVFDLVYVMTQGGPVNATEMLSTYSYRLSFNEFSFSRGAAVANIMFIFLFIIGLGYLKLIKEDEVM